MTVVSNTSPLRYLIAVGRIVESLSYGNMDALKVQAYLLHAPPILPPKQLSAEEIDRALDDAADLIPEGIPPLSDHAMSRESIYTREDDWNR